MKHFRLFSIFVILAMVFSLGTSPSVAKAPQAESTQASIDKIETTLLDAFASEGSADFILRFNPQADLTAAYSMDWDARGEFVVQALTEASLVQQAAKDYLDGRGLKYQTFIAGNDLYVYQGVQTDALTLSALVEVDSIRATRVHYIEPQSLSLQSYDIPQSPDALAWGISYVKADQFWTAFGVQGDGIKVANIDTGVQYNHPGLDQAFACASPTDAACWSDPSNICGAAGACDNNGHGTHTMGTMVSDDDPGLTWQAGMAPNATWIACKGCETNSCSDTALNACADWILAPGGSSANRPNVVNNSWGGGGGDPWYQAKVQAWVAAGVFPAFSAGNSGPTCTSMGDPGTYQESFASGNHTNTGAINSGSSRGPSQFGHDPYTKPNIAAPGTSVCSTVPTNGWSCGYTGTSMASPHSAGAVALLWSCNPSLVGQIDQTFQILQNNSVAPPDAGNCGAPPDGQGNYTYGYGLLDVLAAGVAACGSVDTGHIDGHVYEQDGVTPVEGVTVTAAPALNAGGEIEAVTDPTGYYTMTLVVGTYDVTALKAGYATQTVTDVDVLLGETTTVDFDLEFMGAWTPAPAMCFDLTRIDAEYFPATELVYILGGRGGADGSVTDPNIYSFDPVTGNCADTGEDMPFPISNYTINLVNNGTADVLCTFGGRGAAGTSILNVQCYDPLTNTATNVGNLPAAYTGYTPGAQAVVDNMVYIFGGFNNAASPYELVRTDRWDPTTGIFTQIGDLSQARAYLDVAVVDGAIYAFGGTAFDGTNLNAQTKAEVMVDPGGAGTWDDAAVADLPTATAEGRAFGFDTGSPYGLENQIVIAAGGQWPAETAEAFVYDIATDTYDYSFPDLVVARRDTAGVFVPIETADPTDGMPAMWIIGGRSGADTPPYAGPEFYPLGAGPVAEPDIVVTPALLDVDVEVETTLTVPVEICNTGDAPLDWEILEQEASRITQTPVVREASQPVELSFSGAGGASVETVPPVTLAPVELVLDDGSRDNDIGLGGTIEMLWVNRFTPSPDLFPFELTEVQFYFSSLGLVNVGDDILIIIYETPGGADPAVGSNLLATYPTTIQALDVWNVYTLPVPVVFNGPGDVLIGAIGLETPGTNYWPASMDQTATQARSWAGWWNASPPPDPPVLPPENWTLIDAYFPGNWMVRGYGETITVDVPWLSEDPTSGTVAPGACVVVDVTFDAAGLMPGEYTANLIVTSNDPDTPEITIPVTMTVFEVEEFFLYMPVVVKDFEP